MESPYKYREVYEEITFYMLLVDDSLFVRLG